MSTYPERRAQRQAAIKKQAKERKREERMTRAVGGCVAVLGIAVGVVLAAIIFQLLIWNLGVVGLVAACGGVVSTISLSTAIGAVLLVGLLSRLAGGSLFTVPSVNK